MNPCPLKKTGTLLLALLTLANPLVPAQTRSISEKWAIIQQVERRSASINRDTTLARAYADFVIDVVKNESADSGLVYAEKAYVLAQNHHWNPGILLALVRKASCLNIANLHIEALNVGLKGLQLAEQQQDRYFQCLFHRSLGNNYDMLDNYDEAIPHYKACLRFSEGVPALLPTRANVLVELGDAYRFHRKQPDRAKTLIEQAIAVYRATDSTSLGYAYDYYGQALTDLKQFDQAETSFVEARQYDERFNKDYLIPEILLHQAELYVAANQYEKAITKAQECLAFSQQKKTVSLYGQRGAYRILYESYKALGKPQNALTSHEQFVEVNEAYTKSSVDQQFRTIRSVYELQTQKEELNQLTINQQRQTERLLIAGLAVLLIFSGYVFYNNAQLRQKNRAIQSALLQGQTLERQRVAADLHDNLGTTLSALHWNLEAIDKTRLTATEQAVYANISQQVNQAYTDVRLLSHNLLPDELAKQGLAAALRNLVGKLNRNTRVCFSLTGNDTLSRFDAKTEFELYSICLELLNNTLKHAKATEGHIVLTQESNNLYLTISDNGTGIGQQEKEGRGLHNITARVASLGGKWTVYSVPGEGVRNHISVPV